MLFTFICNNFYKIQQNLNQFETMPIKGSLPPVKKDHPRKYLIYLITACSAASYFGLIGSYAMIKKYLSEEIGIEEGFLGLLDALNFLGMTLGYIFLLFKPMKLPKRDFLISSLISVFFLSLIPLVPFFIRFAQPALIICHLVTGFLRAYTIVPYMIVIQYFDAAVQNRIAINFWNSFAVLGDVLAVISCSLMLNTFKLNWKLCFFICIGTFLAFAVLQHIISDQVDMDEHHRHVGNPNENTCKQTQSFLTKFFGKAENVWWVIDYAFVGSLYFGILMWFPYYFMHLGYSYQASIISAMYPIFTCLGVLVYQYPILLCPSKAHVVIFAMLGINASFYIIMAKFGSSKQYILAYIIMVALSGLVKGGPYPTITSSQMRLRARTNRDVYFAMTFGRFSLMIFSMLLMIIIGILMQINLKSFLYVLSVTTTMNFLINLFRNLYFGPPGKSPQTTIKQGQYDQVGLKQKQDGMVNNNQIMEHHE